MAAAETISLLDFLLDEQQQLTAVERFAQRHASHGEQRFYRDLIPATPPGPGQQYAFRVDLDLCTGCKACVTACHNLNGLGAQETWRDVGLLIGGIAAAAADDSQAVGAAVTFLVTVGASAVTTPIFAAIISVLYFDQRVRKEGFDLQLLAQGVGAEGYPTASQPTGLEPQPQESFSGWQPPGPPPGSRGGL